MKLISIDFKSDFGIFKNPMWNGEKGKGIYTFDSIHKIAILGIFGNLLGLSRSGFYDKLKHLKIGISINNDIKKKWDIINSHSGFFNQGNNLNINRELLIDPSYRVYVLLGETKEDSELYNILKNDLVGHFNDIYFGRPTFIVNRSGFKEYNYNKVDKYKGTLDTIFPSKYSEIEEDSEYNLNYIFGNNDNDVFEKELYLPVTLTEDRNNLKRYGEYVKFTYTNKEVVFDKETYIINDSYGIYLF